MAHTLTLHRFDPSDPRLARHVHHDSRSLDFAYLPRDATPTGKSVTWLGSKHSLNQGHKGSCTGNAVAQNLNTDFMASVRKLVHNNRFLTEKDAVKIYSLGTTLDPYPGSYPPDDTGCDGLSVAKAGVKLGYLSSYAHTFSFQSMQAAVEQTPLICGTVWTNTMFQCNNGLVSVGSLADSNVAGGHEYEGAGIDWTEEVLIFRQSWGDSWPGSKPGGYFAIKFKEYQPLLALQGDVTILVGKGM